MSHAESFEGTLVAARTGAEWAWTEIYRSLAPRVRGYLRAHGAVEADDLTEEVFLHVVRDLSTFEGNEAQFRTWVFAIAYHRLIDDKRRVARRPVDPVPDIVLEQDAPMGNAETDALVRLDQADIEHLLSGLSIDQRQVLLLRILGQLTVEETARVLGKNPGAVKALQRRGLASLKKKIFPEAVSL